MVSEDVVRELLHEFGLRVDEQGVIPNKLRLCDMINMVSHLREQWEAEQQPLTPIEGPPDLTGVEDSKQFVCYSVDWQVWTAFDLREIKPTIHAHYDIPLTPPEQELPKCPWCGGEMEPPNDKHVKVLAGGMCVRCKSCGACGPARDTKAEAIAAGKVGG